MSTFSQETRQVLSEAGWYPGRIPLIVVDEVGYIPFEAEAANLFFQLVSSRTNAPRSS